MAPSSRTQDFNSVLSACMAAYLGKEPQDQIFTDHVLLEVARQKGILKPQNGGETIRVPVEYDTNSVNSYTDYDQLPIVPSDPFTTAYYTWRQLATSVAISGREELQNRGEHAIFALLEGKLANSMSSIRQELNYQLLGKTVASAVWSAGAGATASTTSTDVDPICEMLSRDPTQSVAIGNINKNTYSWWRPFALDMDSDANDHNANDYNDVTTFSETLLYLNRLYLNCSRGGGGRPDCIIASQGGFEIVEAAMRDKVRYMQTGEGSVAFDNIMFKAGAPMYWDEMMPDVSGGYAYNSSSFSRETFYFLNTRTLNIVYDPQTNFKASPFVKPENSDARTSLILWYGNLCWKNPRKNGIAYGLDPSISS